MIKYYVKIDTDTYRNDEGNRYQGEPLMDTLEEARNYSRKTLMKRIDADITAEMESGTCFDTELVCMEDSLVYKRLKSGNIIDSLIIRIFEHRVDEAVNVDEYDHLFQHMSRCPVIYMKSRKTNNCNVAIFVYDGYVVKAEYLNSSNEMRVWFLETITDSEIDLLRTSLVNVFGKVADVKHEKEGNTLYFTLFKKE